MNETTGRDDLREFASLVRAMRRAQAEYFLAHPSARPPLLRAAKDAEYRVDAAVNRILVNQKRMEF